MFDVKSSKKSVVAGSTLPKLGAFIGLFGILILVASWLFRFDATLGIPVFTEREFLSVTAIAFISSTLLIYSVFQKKLSICYLCIFQGLMVVLLAAMHQFDGLRDLIFSWMNLSGLLNKSSALSQDVLVTISMAALGFSLALVHIKHRIIGWISDFFSLSVFVISMIIIGSTVIANLMFGGLELHVVGLLYLHVIMLFLSLSLLFSSNADEKIHVLKRYGPSTFKISNLPIPSKLMFSFTALIFLLLSFSVITQSFVNSLESDLLASRIGIDNARSLLLDLHNDEQDVLFLEYAEQQSQKVGQYDAHVKNWHRNYSALHQSIDDLLFILDVDQFRGERGALEKAKKALFTYHDLFTDHLENPDSTTVLETREDFLKLIQTADIQLLSVQSTIHSTTEQAINFIRIFLILSSGWFIVMAVFFAVYMSRVISIPILELKSAAEAIAKGKLRTKIRKIYEDEVGELADSFSQMTSTLVKSYEKEKHMSQDLSEEKAKDEAILQSIGDGLIAVNNKGEILFANEVALSLVRSTIEDVKGEKVDVVLPLSDENGLKLKKSAYPAYHDISEELALVTNKLQFIRSEKKQIPLSLVITQVRLDGKVIGKILAFRDISKEKEIDRAKTEFVSLASHQLRTPLTSMKWYIEMLLGGEFGQLNKEQHEYLSEAYENTERMSKLVTALLNVSRIELGTFGETPEECDITEIADSVIEDHSSMVALKHLEIVRNYAKKLPTLYVDPRVMRIILTNLITNSAKYSEYKGHVELCLTQGLAGGEFGPLRLKHKSLLIRVKDTGYGIPEEQQPKIFSKLFRADNVKDLDTDGTGLGLYIVKSIIEQFHGEIMFKSKEHEGTVMYISIPLDRITRKKSFTTKPSKTKKVTKKTSKKG